MSVWVLPDEGLFECSLGRCHGMLRGPYADDDETLAAARLHLASVHGEETRGGAKPNAQLATGMRCDQCAEGYKVKGSGLCAVCKRAAATERQRAKRIAAIKPCSVADCEGKAQAKGLCAAHYMRQWAKTTERPIDHGTPGAYRNRRCRCAVCKEAESARRADAKAKRAEESHGTPQGYWSGCRCQPCRDASAVYQREKAAERGPVEFEHGTLRGYNAGRCRCDSCRAAMTEYSRARRARKAAEAAA